MEARRLVITGLVQGVGFRYAMLAQARLLGINGWVRNRRNGSVEAVISGDPAQIAAMLDWSRSGPAGAAVDKVKIETASGAFVGFELHPSA
jgi:acylphosphatase